MMTRNDLVAITAKLPQVEEKFANEYSSNREMLVDQMNQKMLDRADIGDLVGEKNSDLMKDNHANHARFLESIFHQHNPEVLVDTVLWVFRAYKSRNFASTYWVAQLNAWLDVYKVSLSSDCFNAIYPYYNWMMINIPTFNNLAEENLELKNSAH